MPEQLALEEILGNGAAVDGHERPVLARAAAVDLVRDQLLAGAGLAGDEHADVGARHLVDLAEDVAHGVAGADDVAVRVLVEAVQQSLLVRAQLIELPAQLHQQDRGAAEAGRHLQLAVGEQIRQLVVSHVDGADHLAAHHQRQAHHRGQLEIDHALAGVELRVVQGVLDPQRLARLHHAPDDGVGEALDRVGDVLALEVPGLEDLRDAVVDDEDEPLVRPDHLDQGVE